MIKRVLSIVIICLIMSGVLLTGCNSQGGKSGENEAVSQTAGEGDNNDEKGNVQDNNTAQESTKEIITYELTFNVWENANQFEGGNRPKYYDLVAEEINKRLEKEKGIRIKFNPLSFPPTQVEEKINIELASGKSIDLIKVQSFYNIFTSYVDKLCVADITDSLKNYGQNILNYYDKAAFEEYSREGRIYAIPQVDFPYPVCGWLRNDWFDKAGLAIPSTLEELENAMKVIRDGDLDGNGKDDTLPLTGNVAFLIDWLVGMYSTHPNNYFDGERIRSKYEDPGMKDTLLLLQKWYKEKFIDDTIFDSSVYGISVNLFAKNKLAIEIGNIWRLEWSSLNAVYKSRKQMDFRFLPSLKEVKTFPATSLSNSYIFVPISSKNPDIVIQYLDWLYESEENYVLAQQGLGIKGMTYVLDENNVPDIPPAEKEAGIKQGQILSGPYSNIMIVEHNLKYTPATTPEETKVAYNWSMNLDKSKIFLPVTNRLGASLSENLRIKEKDCNTVINEYIQKIIKGEATYEQMIDKWKKAGGDEIFNEYTRMYNEK